MQRLHAYHVTGSKNEVHCNDKDTQMAIDTDWSMLVVSANVVIDRHVPHVP